MATARFQHLTLVERRFLFWMQGVQLSVTEMATRLGRHRSTIYRELCESAVGFGADQRDRTLKRLIPPGSRARTDTHVSYACAARVCFGNTGERGSVAKRSPRSTAAMSGQSLDWACRQSSTELREAALSSLI